MGMQKKKNRTKQVFSLAALLLMLITVFSCFSAAAASENEEQSNGTGKKYIIAMDTTFAPFEFEDSQGNRVGIDVELLEAIAKDQGFEYEARAIGFDAALQAVESGQADGILAGCSITEERQKKMDFSTPYFDSGISMAVSKENDSIQSYEDLRGKKVAVKVGTEGATLANKLSEQYGFSVVTFDDSANMYEDVKLGNTAACFEDYPVLGYAISQDIGLKLVGEKEAGSSYGLGVKKGQNAELLQMFNDGLENVKASGEYQRILDSYISSGDGTAANVESNEGVNFFTLLGTTFPRFVQAAGVTLWITAVSLVFAVVLGLLFCSLRLSKYKVLHAITRVYLWVIRGTPVIVQAFMIYFGIPKLFGFTMPVEVASIITLTLNAGAYLSEIFRSGIEAVDVGQMEAARSLGLPYMKTMQKVILPQAARIVIPSVINQFIITLKDSSILSVIGLAELTKVGKAIVAQNLESFNTYLILAIYYLILVSLLTALSAVVERRLRRGKLKGTGN